MADDDLMNQDEIEQLLNKAKAAPPASAAPAADASPPTESTPLAQDAIENLLKAAGSSAAAPAKAAAKASPASDDDSRLLAQDDIEKLLNQAGKSSPPPPPPAAPARDGPALLFPGEGNVPQGDVEYLLNQAEQALASIGNPHDELPQGVASFRLEEFSGAPASTETATLDLIRDVELDLRIELGRTNMYLEDVLKLRRGSVVPLDRLAGDPVDIFVNGRLIARGEVLVLNDNFCVRVAELIAGSSAFSA